MKEMRRMTNIEVMNKEKKKKKGLLVPS